jgi:radical SAM protein with 4Fe4S-binding SPASM domain
MNLINKLNIKQSILDNNGVMPLPKKLTFEPTLACNLTCTMCDRYEKPTRHNVKYLGLKEIKEIIEKLPKSIREVYIVGGEPLIRNDIIDICKEFLKKGIKVKIHTNGTFVDVTLELSKIKGIKVLFSIDGPTDVHNKIRGQSKVYERNMKIFRELKNQKKNFSVTSVIAEENIDMLIEMITMLKKEGVKPNFLTIELTRRYTKNLIQESADILKIKPSDIPMHLKENVIPSYSFEKFKESVIELDKELKKLEYDYFFHPRYLLNNLKEFYYRTFRKNNELYCTHFDELRIDSKGNINHCHIFRKNFGNVFERPIEEIWNSKEFCEFRVNLIKNNLSPVCETCYRAKNISFIKNSYVHLSRLYSKVNSLKKKEVRSENSHSTRKVGSLIK